MERKKNTQYLLYKEKKYGCYDIINYLNALKVILNLNL